MRGCVQGLLPLLCAGLLLGGCAVGPDFHRPAAPQVQGYLPAAEAQQSTGDGIDGASVEPPAPRWWTGFNSPAIDALVEQALHANPTLAVAQANLREAQELTLAQRGSYLPQLQASFDASRQKNAVGVLSPTLNSGAAIFNLFTPQLVVSFVPDLLGANRRLVESYEAQAEAAGYARDATYQTLVANVVSTALQIAGLTEQVAAAGKVIALEEKALRVLMQSQAAGAVSAADVAAQQTLLAQAQAALPPLTQQLAQQQHLLAVLTGTLPSQAPPLLLSLSELSPPMPVPLGIPSQLVDRRPDVRAAEAQLHAATAQVGVATAAMLPQLTISGGVGSTATQMGDLFRNGTNFWSGGASLSQTLFAGGALRHHRRAAIDAMDAAGAQYRATVLAAFQGVADALHALMSDAEVLRANERAAEAAQVQLQAAQVQLANGAASFLSLASAEQAYQQTQIALVAARVNRYTDTVALYQALGGGPVPPSP